MTTPKVLCLCLDAATFDVLDPLLAEGVMPNLARLIADGVSGPLETVIPPITPPAWVSWMMGQNPGKHGVFEFLVRAPAGSLISRSERTCAMACRSGICSGARAIGPS